MGYTKLFAEIVASSIWDSDNETRVLWVTMLALKDRDHFVRATRTYLAAVARLTPDEFEAAIKKLERPDPLSRTPDHEGRRVQAEAGGWVILNGAKYAAKLNQSQMAEYKAEKAREYRARKKAPKHAGACAGARQAIHEAIDGADVQ